ncbi:MAG: hypothetical protein QXV17_14245 [Candidatus Micrarchaeaceae archaeon]
MWIKKEEKQTIVFIDPKGLEHTKGLDDEKIVFAGFKHSDPEAVTIKEIEQRLNKENVVLESFILSKTAYEKLIEGMTSPPSKEQYIKQHVLFLDDENWQEKLFSILLKPPLTNDF